MSSSYIKIPRERVGALIGADGGAKEYIERRGQVTLKIDSKTGEVGLIPKPDVDPVKFWCSMIVVKAIGRGFSPKRAFRLFDEEECVFDVIDLRSFLGKTSSRHQRVKGRIIGKRGKIRAMIEEIANVYLSVYGHTVGIIGKPDQVRAGKEAVMMLIKGVPHKTVLRFLYRWRGELKRERGMRIWK